MKANRKAEKKQRQKERKEHNTAEDDPNIKAELVVMRRLWMIKMRKRKI